MGGIVVRVMKSRSSGVTRGSLQRVANEAPRESTDPLRVWMKGRFCGVPRGTAVLLDRRLLQLDANAYKQFTAAIDKSPTASPELLRRLLPSEAPWER